MYNSYQNHSCPYYGNIPMYNNVCNNCPYCNNTPMNDYRYIPFAEEIEYDSVFDYRQSPEEENDLIELRDYGPEPFVVNINEASKQNDTFRTALWTGKHLQVTLMSIDVGEDIGLEIHPHLDQFIRIEEGEGVVKMGNRRDNLDFQAEVYDDFAFVIPAGKWHNLINTGNMPIKLYSIYAPPQHPYGTVHVTKADAEAAEEEHHQ